eukprot:189766-Prymnesium_polylepis.1
MFGVCFLLGALSSRRSSGLLLCRKRVADCRFCGCTEPASATRHDARGHRAARAMWGRTCLDGLVVFTPRERFARASTRSRRNMPHAPVFCFAS